MGQLKFTSFYVKDFDKLYIKFSVMLQWDGDLYVVFLGEHLFRFLLYKLLWLLCYKLYVFSSQIIGMGNGNSTQYTLLINETKRSTQNKSSKKKKRKIDKNRQQK